MDPTFRIFAGRERGDRGCFKVVHQLCGETVLLTEQVNVDELPRICNEHQCYTNPPEKGAT